MSNRLYRYLEGILIKEESLLTDEHRYSTSRFLYTVGKAFKESEEFILWVENKEDRRDYVQVILSWAEKVEVKELEEHFNPHELMELLRD